LAILAALDLSGHQSRVAKYSTSFICSKLMSCLGRGGARHFHLGGPVLQQGELSMVCVGLSEEDLKNFEGATGGARQNFGGALAPPGTPLAPPLCLGLAFEDGGQ